MICVCHVMGANLAGVKVGFVVHALEGDIRASAGERHRALFSLLSPQAWLLAFISLLRAIKHPSMAVSALFPFSFAFTQ